MRARRLLAEDNGASWTAVSAGYDLHNTPIADAFVDLVNPQYVYAASYGRGSWTYDWATNLPSCQ